ncbi:MAG: DMT family transporter [Atribacter sp.]|jgi:drug/metabolite transporter (DMT)-like permease|uniref:Putative inner membrane transporter YhbE n=1 Tax=Candidatus Atribacter allofermentans TaxID=1852833 RepID=A0A1V5T3K2_9BACT|nr:MAG: putative inner membrane transporter YhbE [Candidatus Atribacteria bacterium ADurb.Bin276]HHT09602.1 DMT family transporter [Candidatus Atribacteria bacterium]
MKINRSLIADFSLAGVCLVWGGTFVMMKNILSREAPLNVLFWRFTIATLFLLLILPQRLPDKNTFKYGLILGTALFGGYLFQTFGLVYTTPARSAFITGLSVILVPFFSFAFLRTKLKKETMIGVAMALVGLAFLTFNPTEFIKKGQIFGDLLTLVGAAAYGLQIVLVEKFSQKSQALPLVIVEMGTVAFLSFLLAISFRSLRLPAQWIDVGQFIFLGTAATGLAFAIQKVAQKHTTAIHVGIIFVLEPVFAAVVSYFLWQEKFTPRTLAGCFFIVAGILFSEISSRLFNHSPDSESTIFKSNSKPST